MHIFSDHTQVEVPARILTQNVLLSYHIKLRARISSIQKVELIEKCEEFTYFLRLTKECNFSFFKDILVEK
jgi:hypothetical protein